MSCSHIHKSADHLRLMQTALATIPHRCQEVLRRVRYPSVFSLSSKSLPLQAETWPTCGLELVRRTESDGPKNADRAQCVPTLAKSKQSKTRVVDLVPVCYPTYSQSGPYGKHHAKVLRNQPCSTSNVLTTCCSAYHI
jgi:hypothetical protein